jgi:hypothetical protein
MINICKKNQSLFILSSINLAKYILFSNIQSMSGLTIIHHKNKHKYIKIGTKALNLSIKLA